MNDTFLIFGDTSTKLAPHSQENRKAGKSQLRKKTTLLLWSVLTYAQIILKWVSIIMKSSEIEVRAVEKSNEMLKEMFKRMKSQAVYKSMNHNTFVVTNLQKINRTKVHKSITIRSRTMLWLSDVLDIHFCFWRRLFIFHDLSPDIWKDGWYGDRESRCVSNTWPFVGIGVGREGKASEILPLLIDSMLFYYIPGL